AVVTTVHDVSFRMFPEWFSLKDRLLLDWGLRATLRVVKGVLSVSERTAEDLRRFYDVPAGDITVTPNALGEGFTAPGKQQMEDTLARLEVSRPYALFVGVLQPRKNIVRIVRAFMRARAEHSLPHQLVIAGKVGWKSGRILETVASAEAAGAVRRLGYVDDADLPALYAGADVFVFPTLYEGFGIPVLEAFACDTPVLASDTGALPEVAGDAALLVPPADEEAIAEGIVRLISDSRLRERMIAAGRARLERYSWRRTALLTLAAYERAVSAE
ncbi:MAG: glycosyltransferase family 4 protein, partial [Armatimonadetes bacterium]|nr:glycosyltransferase family 4 protein [Armatimonadota bacterium]